VAHSEDQYVDPLYVAARHVLLDALEALSGQLPAVILVGAHAVYIRTGDADLGTTPFTTDADVAIDPARLASHPRLDEALEAGGFVPKMGVGGPVVGSWVREVQMGRGARIQVDLDLLVPEAVSGKGSRAARLGSHGDRTARKARGLELALIDNEIMRLGALDASDGRFFDIRIAGVAALLVSKAIKVADRLDDPRRDHHIAKDALDMLRLLRGAEAGAIAGILRDAYDSRLANGGRARLQHAVAEVSGQAIAILRQEFSADRARGCALAGQAAAGRDDPGVIAASLAALVQRLLKVVDG